MTRQQILDQSDPIGCRYWVVHGCICRIATGRCAILFLHLPWQLCLRPDLRLHHDPGLLFNSLADLPQEE